MPADSSDLPVHVPPAFFADRPSAFNPENLGDWLMGKPRLLPGATTLARALVLAAAGFLFVTNPAPAASPTEPIWTAEQQSHWSYLPPKRPPLPEVKNPGWVRNSVDAFILAAIEANDLTPAPEAPRATLIRRLRFDLTGLPPTPDEVDAFLRDTRPDAYERLVDRLLESSQYGERWARFWLDLARFAESDGFKSDLTRPTAWRYRDWVVKAVNADLPYDRFLAYQVAGDEVAPSDPDAFIATGFNRNFPFEDNNKVPGLNHQLMLDDVTDTTTSVVLGMTLACARCHDHKFDPISQKDYYRFQALFAATEVKDDRPLVPLFELAVRSSVEAEYQARIDRLRTHVSAIERPYLAPLLKETLNKLPAEVRKAVATATEERTAAQEDLLAKYRKELTVPPRAMESALTEPDRRVWIDLGGTLKGLTDSLPPPPPTASGMADTGPTAPAVHMFFKGNFASPGDEVGPGFPSIFQGVLPPFQPEPTFQSTGRRKALAAWLARPDHPRTARVMVNRVWQNHFGRGIVATPSDFGTQGAEPSHPELLDWLATEFVRENWSLKALHRLMVTSATYRQSSTPTPEALENDPDNTLVSRMPRRRLEGEAVRDALLAVSGQLVDRLGGPSVFPDLPPGMETRGGWTRSASASDRNRRSIYVFVRRNLKYPLFEAFDAPDTNTTCPERNVTVNAPQALMLLNSDLVLSQARALAGRLLTTLSVEDRNDPASVVSLAYRLAFSRAPQPVERSRGLTFLEDQAALLSSRAGDPKGLDLPTPTPDGYSPVQAAALVDYCHALLNLNEFVFVD